MSIIVRNGRLVLGAGNRFRWQGQIPYNQAPLSLSLSPAMVGESATPGTVVGLITVTDPGDTVWTWTITEQSTPGLFGFTTGSTFNGGHTNLVVLGTVPLYSVRTSHTVTIRVQDPEGGAYNHTLTVGVIPTAGDTLIADVYFQSQASPVLGIAEGTPADPGNAIGSINFSNPSNGVVTGYTWSITAQSTAGLFSLGTTFNGSTSINLHLAQTMPSWTSTAQSHSVTVKTTDAIGNFFHSTIDIPVLRNGPAARLYPLDGYTITEGVSGPIGQFAAAGSVNRTYSYAIVGDDRFTFSGNRLSIVNPLTNGTYDIVVRVTNTSGSQDFPRTITVRDKTLAETGYPWWSAAQAGAAPTVSVVSFPQTLRLRNESTGAVAANDYVFFSLSFPPGAVGMSQRPVFTVGGTALSAQIDGMRYWRDGSGNPTSFQGGRFLLKIPSSWTAGETKTATITVETASAAEFSSGFNNEFAKSNTTVSLTTTEPRTVAQAKGVIVGKGYRVRATIDGVAHTATLNQAALDEARTRLYGQGKHGHGFRVMTAFLNNSTNAAHTDMAVQWYVWVYDSGLTEVMPVIHNSYYGGRTDHTLTAVTVERTSPSVLALSTWAGPISHYGHSIWFAGDTKVRPLRDDGTPAYLHADYSQCIPMLAAAGVWPKYGNNLAPGTPNPVDPSHVPCGKTFAPSNPSNGALVNCNYGNAIGPVPDWCARFITTGDSAWLKVCRVVAADWGVWPYFHTDNSSGDILGSNNGWSLGTQTVGQYAPVVVSDWSTSTSLRTGLDANPADLWTRDNFANPWFVVAYTTARPWWTDALAHGANWCVASENAAGPTTTHRGYRYWRVNGKQYLASPLQSEQQAACVMSAISGVEFLHGDTEIRQGYFRDLLRDPYAALVEWTVNGQPRQFSNGTVEYNTAATWRPYGHAYLRNNTAVLAELDYWAASIAIDILRRRWWLDPYVGKWANYYLRSLVYGRAAASATGGAGCAYWATLDQFKFRTSPTDAESDTSVLDARGWSEVAYRWRSPDWKIHTIAPGHAPFVGGLKAWYTVSRASCRPGTFRGLSGGYQSGSNPAIARGAAQIGVHAGIGNATAALASYAGMLNYTIDPAFYRNNLDRWFIVA